ncbi:DUF6496 domain-containing protein [Sphingomonas morindae]|uniref:DUF6496 domain-containing protein n=1 Tax=Sphingomonas morindae TaxID=1541170 RepID=A0ABY4X628_9SPHN|nr:DUF6496 domain-containing protein [Sphingomonas morindae]USI72331.1 DUF6496 domain-containing protein [Sphingomonas morindae]
MAKQSGRQKAVVERVLHEFKQGTLESGSGAKVKSRRQAVAIGLSEAGASDRQTPAENRKRLRTTEARQAAGGETKASLYARARARNIPGRSRMSKAALIRALE